MRKSRNGSGGESAQQSRVEEHKDQSRRTAESTHLRFGHQMRLSANGHPSNDFGRMGNQSANARLVAPVDAPVSEATSESTSVGINRRRSEWAQSANESIDAPISVDQPRYIITIPNLGACKNDNVTKIRRVDQGNPCLWSPDSALFQWLVELVGLYLGPIRGGRVFSVSIYDANVVK